MSSVQIFTLSSENDNLQRKLMDYNARNNKVTLLPWDVYFWKRSVLYGNRYYTYVTKGF